MTEAPEAPVAEMGMPAEAPAAPLVDASPAPAEPSKPAADTPSKQNDVMQEALDHLDDLLGPGEKLPPKLEKARAKPKDQKPDPKAQAKPEPKAEEPKPGEPKPKPDEQAKPQAAPAKELRAAYEAQKAKLKQYETELAEARQAKPKQDDPEKKALLERVQSYEKRLKDLDDELKYSAYERSDEYKEKYHRPFEEAFRIGRSKASALKVTGDDGNVRQGTPEDFDRIMMVADEEQAYQLAEAMFGKASQIVLFHREKVQSASELARSAIQEYRKNGSERLKQMEEHKQVQATKMRQLWEEENKRVTEKYEWFRPKDEDAEGNKLLEQGYHLADMAFSGEHIASLPLEKQVQIHAAVRNRAAAFGRVALWNKQLTSRVAELEKELADYKASQPAAGDGDERQPSASAGDEMANALASLDKRSRPGPF